MYRLKPIGIIEAGSPIVITVDREFRKALKYLNQFSHIHVFYISGHNRLENTIIELEQVDQSQGKLTSSTELKMEDACDLIDIKPYFPCEDTVREVRKVNQKQGGKGHDYDQMTETDTEIINISVEQCEEGMPYGINTIGQIRNVNGKSYIQLEQLPVITSSHIKIFWWFHKFDSDLYRGITMCDPPYENAPKTGIFATRSPVRPNPIAMTIARVTRIDQKLKRIYLNGIESFDKTPCVGVCDYNPETDRIPDCQVPKWLEHWPKYLDDQELKVENEIHIEDSPLVQMLSEINESQMNSMEKDIIHDNNDQKINTEKPDGIIIHGARENNLKGISVKIPYGKITAVVGVSGSGKSSLVNDTIYAECNRRMEYLSHNHNMAKPSVDEMFGCIPTVVISQDAIRGNAFSTVGTYTDAYDYLRGIYAGIALRHCPDCGHEILPLSKERIYSLLQQRKRVTICDLNHQALPQDTLANQIDSALELGQGAFYAKTENGDDLLLQTKQKCFHCDKILFEMTPASFSYMDADSRCPVCNGTGKVVKVDEEKIIDHPERSLLDGASSFYGKLRTFRENSNANWMKGQVFGLAQELDVDLEQPWRELPEKFRDIILHGADMDVTFEYMNKKNGRKGEITRKVEGICNIIERFCEENTDTHTLDRYLSKITCETCHGERLNMEGRTAAVLKTRYPKAAQMTFSETIDFCNRLYSELPREEYKRIENAVRALLEIAECAVQLGIGYLELSQDTGTLSGGEGQRLKLLGAFKNHISGILYIFDEPSKALHPSDYEKIMFMLRALKKEGNTIIMVEHNEDMIRVADYVIEIGPGAGEKGGTLVGEGTLEAMLQHQGTQICRYMGEGGKLTKQKTERSINTDQMICMQELTHHNLKNISITFPQNAVTCICGVSGSGKSSLMKGEIYAHAKQIREFAEVVLVDQQPIGKTSKSIVATYIGVMDSIRNAFAATEFAVQNGWDEKYFSFNGQSGQCDTCKGEGRIKLKYMEDTYVQCPDCKGQRYRREILKVHYKDKNIADILELSVHEAVEYMDGYEDALTMLHSLQRVGLGYLKLGQGTATLSGGEASRLKLSKELMMKKKGKVLYLLDEPTTGLHFSDIDHLIRLMEELIESGNTVVAIEHNKQFLQRADWLIKLGPGAGKAGGEIMYQGVYEA